MPAKVRKARTVKLEQRNQRMLAAFNEGQSVADISKEFGVGRSQTYAIINRELPEPEEEEKEC